MLSNHILCEMHLTEGRQGQQKGQNEQTNVNHWCVRIFDETTLMSNLEQ